MFVQRNTLQEIKNYFHNELTQYSKSEVNLIVKSITFNILNINDSEYILGENLLLSESELLQFNALLKPIPSTSHD